MKILKKKQHENQDNQENLRTPFENYKNYEVHRNSCENHANHENLTNQLENYENHENLNSRPFCFFKIFMVFLILLWISTVVICLVILI